MKPNSTQCYIRRSRSITHEYPIYLYPSLRLLIPSSVISLHLSISQAQNVIFQLYLPKKAQINGLQSSKISKVLTEISQTYISDLFAPEKIS